MKNEGRMQDRCGMLKIHSVEFQLYTARPGKKNAAQAILVIIRSNFRLIHPEIK